jgi:hypothetical protein
VRQTPKDDTAFRAWFELDQLSAGEFLKYRERRVPGFIGRIRGSKGKYGGD